MVGPDKGSISMSTQGKNCIACGRHAKATHGCRRVPNLTFGYPGNGRGPLLLRTSPSERKIPAKIQQMLRGVPWSLGLTKPAGPKAGERAPREHCGRNQVRVGPLGKLRYFRDNPGLLQRPRAARESRRGGQSGNTGATFRDCHASPTISC